MKQMFKHSKVSVLSASIYSATPSSSESSQSSSDDRGYDDSDSDMTFSINDWDDGVVKEEPNPVKWVINNEAYCFDVVRFSEKLIQATYIEAIKRTNYKSRLYTVLDVVTPMVNHIFNAAVPCPSSPVSSEESSNPLKSLSSSYLLASEGTDWPKISEFNIKLGLEKIEDYVATWERHYEWLFCVEFLGFECEECSNVFVYEVEWSKPTNAYPIPQATASVYFALEVFKMVPYNYDRVIDVSYVFESSNVIHLPGKIDFQEKWLEDIIESKLKFFKTVTFSTPAPLEWERYRLRQSRAESHIHPVSMG